MKKTPSPKDMAAEKDRRERAAQMARAEFGRFYVDAGRMTQKLRKGEIVLSDRGGRRKPPPD